ncbi:LOW QUALITY PROTEIN: hypothetical protein PanWU01x14_311330 [Parasponia andersonii]|uniref:Uncharacterized protein n=1 Tax=Parasponia andersonii TaxID=3476 RepID=A0A2P5AQ27_PARAD|nr:LOW QUALITY PROTEIN: hypothetical protein PanWU01x14_311330 [Parasponia andersonii]
MQHGLSKRVFLSFFSPLSNDFTYLFSFFVIFSIICKKRQNFLSYYIHLIKYKIKKN